MRKRHRNVLLLVLGILLPMSLAVSLSAQTVGVSDSLLSDAEDGLYYEIAKTRLIRWIREKKELLSKEELEQLVDLLREAQGFAREGDYETALLMVETAMEIVGIASDADLPPLPPPAEAVPEELHRDVPSGWSLVPQVVTGIDVRHQEFQMGSVAGSDSILIERTGSPYVGLRLKADTDFSYLGRFNAYVSAQAGRDFNSGEMQFKWQRGTLQASHWFLENRLESTRYKRDLNVRYWENRTTLQAGVKVIDRFVIYAGDDFWLRRYRQDANFYPSYTQNQLYSGFQYTSGLSTRLAARYNFATRRYRNFTADDFNEHRIEASVYQVTAVNSSIYLENIWRSRRYIHGDSDSTYQNSYQEEFFRADLRFGLNPWLSFDVNGDFTLRQHRLISAITPDFMHIRVNPRFLFRVFGDWQIGLGYVYALRIYSKDIIRTQPVLSATPVDIQLGYEDYFSHGISVSLELFRLGAFMLSLTDQYQFLTYPNSLTKRVDGFEFYTDRKINSILMFLTWQVQSGLELNFIVNLDDDRSRINNNTDSRSNIISLEMSYSF